MSQIAPELIDRMMVKCARRCCICRRFRPTKLQVHHIDEKAKGGSDEEDNLIVVCLSCHTDVHTKVPFARRFSVEELKGHRDALIQFVAEGKLPANDSDDADQAIAQIVKSLGRLPHTSNTLTPEAIEILLTAVESEGPLRETSTLSNSTAALRSWWVMERHSAQMIEGYRQSTGTV